MARNGANRGIDYYPEQEPESAGHGLGKPIAAVGAVILIAGAIGGKIVYDAWQGPNQAASSSEPNMPPSSPEDVPSSTIPSSSSAKSSPTSSSPNKSSPTPTPTKASPTSTLIPSIGVSVVVPPGATSSVPSTDIDKKIASNMIVGFDASTTSFDEIKHVVEDTGIGGVFLTNTQNGNKLYQRLSKLPEHLLLVSDEEGGQVHRLADGFTPPSARQLGQMNLQRVQDYGKREGQVMRACGVTLDLGPVLDIDNKRNDNNPNDVISHLDRSFGYNADTVISHAGAFIAGLHDAGVGATVKHFPDIGSASGAPDYPDNNTDAHAATTPNLSYLEGHGLLPHQKILTDNSAEAVMASNATVPGLTKGPASISPEVVQLIRDGYGFKGATITDSLTALGGKNFVPRIPLPTAIADSVKAGFDAPLFSFTTEQAITRAIAKINNLIKTGQISASQIDDSSQRVDALRNVG